MCRNEHAAEMDIIAPDDACTMCVHCGTNTMLIESHHRALNEPPSEFSREVCLACGQQYRVYQE